jgi:hypothetical protein
MISSVEGKRSKGGAMVPDLDALHEFARRYTADQQLLILFSRRFKRRHCNAGPSSFNVPLPGPARAGMT